MLNQDEIYQRIFKERWTDILEILYEIRKEILNDGMLRQAAVIFEEEFFKQLGKYDLDRKDINDNLDILYILHHGKFYNLSNENYKTLILELVKRKPLEEAVNYARQFPEEDICKLTVKNSKH